MGAIDRALTRGDATFVVNGREVVDVRLESAPGTILIRVSNPNIPKLPFLEDGRTAVALKFVEDVVDVAPAATSASRAVGDFLTWGAPPREKTIRYEKSKLNIFLSSKSNLPMVHDLTNSQVGAASLVMGVMGAYGTSYAYYVKLQEDAEREVIEKKAKAVVAAASAKRKTVAKMAGEDGDSSGESNKVKEEVVIPMLTATTEDTVVDTEKEGTPGTVIETMADAEGDSVTNTKQPVIVESNSVDDVSKGRGASHPRRKRDVLKNLFGRGK